MPLNIEIRKIVQHDNTTRWWNDSAIAIQKRYYLYVVFVDGRRVDAFLYRRNALRKVRSLRDAYTRAERAI